MSLPTQTELKTMDYAYQGQPFVSVPAKSGMGLSSMDYAYLAQPFVTNSDADISPVTLARKRHVWW